MAERTGRRVMVRELIPRPLPVKAQLHLAYEDNAKLRDRIATLEAQLAKAMSECELQAKLKRQTLTRAKRAEAQLAARTGGTSKVAQKLLADAAHELELAGLNARMNVRARDLLAALSPAPEAQQEPVAWQEPELTCPHIERAVVSGELSPAVVDELAAIREINSQLRYGTWALKAQLKAITRPSEQAVTEVMVEAAYDKVRRMPASVDTADGDLDAIIRSAIKAAMEAGR